MTAPTTFRTATVADAAAVGEFMARNFLAAYGHCSSPGNIARAVQEHYGLPAQQRQLADPARVNLLAHAGTVLAGVAQLRFDGERPACVPAGAVPELSRFYVDQAFHGTGIAPALMAALRAEARARGGLRLWLSVWKQSPRAVRFYEKQGFGQVGSTVFMVGDDPMDDWVLLGPA